MPATLITAYEPGSNVNLDYYINTHMPRAFAGFQPYCKRWKVVQAAPAPGMEHPFEVMTLAEFDKVEDIWAAYAAEEFKPVAQWIVDDLTNYAQKKPLVWVVDEKGSGPSSS
ncbi:uncharacterized protein BCR38DRAFT_471088 [Pseudomassariella vexata]|uniref:EthD domain-containing protein n=1 Tax=Pseudomassariella vexata TaxID=1141098 RepID=A0A1Y2EDH9_9PEZI|nr:uncharacterized protein BCR38DRAFT_471088 [Pseudomassariella vexata]ORY69610.1 hypothetical protein BCR38DRAFT_471088 [Pseudomassariella vexata]